MSSPATTADASVLSFLTSTSVLLSVVALGVGLIAVLLYPLLTNSTPKPSKPGEREYLSIGADGKLQPLKQLPCWLDNFTALSLMAKKGLITQEEAHQITEAELFMTLVIPAYNEQYRLTGMLEEAVTYLQQNYGDHGTRTKDGRQSNPGRGWEIILVSDGSTDQTIPVALKFAREHILGTARSALPGAIRVVRLEQNRGKGAAVIHGMRHARGTYVIFADADGASRFSDLGKLVLACQKAKDSKGRVVAVGSRAHMVGTEAVVKRSVLRNTLMHSFHILLRLLTTPKTAKIKDTQCGFKLFSRASLPYIVPYMHSEGWIFDVEMLMLAESAHIPMVEVAIGWKEVKGSKLNVIYDSLGMAYGLAMLRLAWILGIYKR